MAEQAKLSKKVKMIYGLGDVASNFCNYFTGAFLTIFYTDVVGILPAVVSAIIFGARIWDAVNDPMFGVIAERTHTKWGRFRPYILFGTPMMAIFLILTFMAPFSGDNAKVIYATMTYIVLGMITTAVNLSYGSLSSVMTRDPEDRVELNFWRMIGANGGQMILNAIVMPIVLFFSTESGQSTATQPNAKGYLFTAVILAIGMTILFMIVYKNCQERIQPDSKEKIPFNVSIKSVFQNKPILCLFATLFCYIIGLNIHTGLLIYWITYVVKRTDLAALLMTLPSICTLIALFATKNLTRKYGKKKMLLICYAGLIVAQLLLWKADTTNIAMLVVFSALWGFFKFASPIQMGSVPECIDYAEEKFGIRCDGFAYAFVSLATKIGPAIGPSLGLLFLGSGYVPNAEQTAETIKNINFAVNFLPIVFFALAMIPAAMYPITREKAAEMSARLQEKELASKGKE